jgi:hypothetical protein
LCTSENASDLCRALRGGRDDAVIAEIVARVHKCWELHHDLTYKHPMKCGCCGEDTELDLESGVRVLKSRPTQEHYVCTNLKKISDLESKIRREMYFMREILERLIVRVREQPYKK